MNIQDAVIVLGLLGTTGMTFLGVFVGSKISASERRIMDRMADIYLPREVADEKFRYYDRALGENNGNGTPRVPRRSITTENDA